MNIFGDPSSTFPDGGQAGQYTLRSIYDIDPLALGDLLAYIELNPPKIPISQVTGYTEQTPFTATTIQTEQTTTSTAYGDLTTVGPTLTSLPDGQYMVSWGCIAGVSSATTRAIMGMSINGGAPDDTQRAQTNAVSLVGVSFMAGLKLGAGGSNSLTAKYRIGASGVTATFGSRYLTAIRVTGP